jgi:signal transduction histidine kinase
MFKTLRGQLVLSHILPSLVVIPLMGIALVFFLESTFILPRLENQLADEAVLITNFARVKPEIFNDVQLARSLLEDVGLETATRLMILDPEGRLLASSDAEDDSRLNQVLAIDAIKQVQDGTIAKELDFSRGLHGEVVDIFAPVIDLEGRLIGIIRVSYRFATIADQLMEVRYLIMGILLIGILLSAVLGVLLAINIDYPIRKVSHAVFDLARGTRVDPLPEQGPAEIQVLQKAVNFLVTRLRDLEQNRHQLLANLIHEIGRPLGSLRITIQLLRSGSKVDPPVLDELLEGMEMQTSILRRLLEDLSQLHDQLVGSLELKLETVNLSEWLPVILHSERDAALRKGLQWKVDIPGNLPVLEIDPQRISQVVTNLITNAIKYTPRGESVSASAGEQDKMVWIRISDTGPGIPVDEQQKIFDPFFRGTQKQRIKQGMGLGLSISRDFVEAHHGRLQVESTHGLGSSFTIWLPEVREFSDLSELRG